jgi:hypothetical protein
MEMGNAFLKSNVERFDSAQDRNHIAGIGDLRVGETRETRNKKSDLTEYATQHVFLSFRRRPASPMRALVVKQECALSPLCKVSGSPYSF